jgi:molybdenum cofactor cytidylyltransferase
MPPPPSFALAAIILAAGRSSRMGRPKMLLPWKESTVIGHQIGVWSEISKQVAVVYAAGDSALEQELDRVRLPAANRILNPDASRGMFSSIQCSAAWKGWQPDITHFAIALGDQPHLQPATLRTVADFARLHPTNLCQPSIASHGRHPVILPAQVFNTLADTAERSLKDFLEINSALVKLVEVNDPGLDLDLDEPSDYQAALKLSERS